MMAYEKRAKQQTQGPVPTCFVQDSSQYLRTPMVELRLGGNDMSKHEINYIEVYEYCKKIWVKQAVIILAGLWIGRYLYWNVWR